MLRIIICGFQVVRGTSHLGTVGLFGLDSSAAVCLGGIFELILEPEAEFPWCKDFCLAKELREIDLGKFFGAFKNVVARGLDFFDRVDVARFGVAGQQSENLGAVGRKPVVAFDPFAGKAYGDAFPVA